MLDVAPVATKIYDNMEGNGPLENSSTAKFIAIDVQVFENAEEVKVTSHSGPVVAYLEYSGGGIRRGCD